MTSPETGAVRQTDREIHGFGAVGGDGSVGTNRTRYVQPRFVALAPEHQDRPNSGRLQQLEVEQSEWTRPDDRRRLSRLRLDAFERVDGRGQRLQERRSVVAHFVGQRDQRRRGQRRELGEHAVLRQTDVMPVLADVVVTTLAVKAQPAPGNRFDGDTGLRRSALPTPAPTATTSPQASWPTINGLQTGRFRPL